MIDFFNSKKEPFGDSNCPHKANCIGFSHPVQTKTGVFPCTSVYKCKFDINKMYKWETPPIKTVTKQQ